MEAQALEKVVVKTQDAEKKADDTEKKVASKAGRGIQQEATQARAVLPRLPDSPERRFIDTRLANIGSYSDQLFGVPDSSDVAVWQKVATDLFSENAEDRASAQKIIDAQQDQIKSTNAELAKAQEAKARATATAAHALQNMVKAQAEKDEATGFIADLKLIGVYLFGCVGTGPGPYDSCQDQPRPASCSQPRTCSVCPCASLGPLWGIFPIRKAGKVHGKRSNGHA